MPGHARVLGMQHFAAHRINEKLGDRVGRARKSDGDGNEGEDRGDKPPGVLREQGASGICCRIGPEASSNHRCNAQDMQRRSAGGLMGL